VLRVARRPCINTVTAHVRVPHSQSFARHLCVNLLELGGCQQQCRHYVQTSTHPCALWQRQCAMEHLADLVPHKSLLVLPLSNLGRLPGQDELVTLEADVDVLLVDVREVKGRDDGPPVSGFAEIRTVCSVERAYMPVRGTRTSTFAFAGTLGVNWAPTQAAGLACPLRCSGPERLRATAPWAVPWPSGAPSPVGCCPRFDLGIGRRRAARRRPASTRRRSDECTCPCRLGVGHGMTSRHRWRRRRRVGSRCRSRLG